MNRPAARTLLLFAAVVLLLQYGVVGLLSLGVGEPWPAVLQPGFKNVWDGRDTVRIPRADLEVTMADGRIRPVPLDRLFDGVPASHHLGLLRTQFLPSSLSSTHRTERALDPQTRRWLSEQMNRIFPEEQALRVSAVWKEMRFDRASPAFASFPLDTLVIDLIDYAE